MDPFDIVNWTNAETQRINDDHEDRLKRHREAHAKPKTSSSEKRHFITAEQRIEMTRQHREWEMERRAWEAREAEEEAARLKQWEEDNWVSLMFSPGHQLTRLWRWLTK
jgi:hypothetical protein